MAAIFLTSYHVDNEHELTEKRYVIKKKGRKHVLNTHWLFSRFSNSNISESGPVCDFFNMEPMKEMGPTTLVQI